ncbi:MAG: recombinase RecA [Thermoprotei archaeon]|nr:MAG: recombinase RecA [Thermoprotei archaeon]
MPRAIERTPTGIPGLDELIEGGVLKGRTHLIAGETGTCKTIMSLQFLLNGIKRGEHGIYMAIDEDSESVIRGAEGFGWDLGSEIERGNLSITQIVPGFAEKLRKKYIEAAVGSVIVGIKQEMQRIGATRLVIDPIAPLLTKEEDLPFTREYIRELVLAIERELGCTTFIVSEVPTGSNSLSRFGVEEFLASGIITLGLLRRGDHVYRTLCIRKMRWTAVDPVLYKFRVEKGLGIVVEGPIAES